MQVGCSLVYQVGVIGCLDNFCKYWIVGDCWIGCNCGMVQFFDLFWVGIEGDVCFFVDQFMNLW